MINGETTNKVWASADGHNWHQSLPPMSRCRCWPTKAVSSASPECLIVVDYKGGYANIEALFGGKWMSVPSYGRNHFGHMRDKVILHNGSLYVWKLSSFIICYCKVESLLANFTLTEEDHGNKFWKTIPHPPFTWGIQAFVMLSFEQHLLVVCEGSTYVYSPNTQSWVFMDDNLLTERPRCVVTVGDHMLFKTTNYLYHLKTTAGI